MQGRLPSIIFRINTRTHAHNKFGYLRVIKLYCQVKQTSIEISLSAHIYVTTPLNKCAQLIYLSILNCVKYFH